MVLASRRKHSRAPAGNGMIDEKGQVPGPAPVGVTCSGPFQHPAVAQLPHTDPLAAEPSVPHAAPASPRCRRSSGQCHEPCCFVWGARYRASSGFLPEAMVGRANGVTSLERPAEPWQTPSARRARWSLLPLFSRGSKCLGLDTSQRLVNKLRPVKLWQSKYCSDCLQRLQGPRPHRGCEPSEPRSWC